MRDSALRVRWLPWVGGLALLMILCLAGCSGGFGPVLPSPGGSGGVGVHSFTLLADPGDPNSVISNAVPADFTVHEDAVAGGHPSVRPITQFQNNVHGSGARAVLALDHSSSMTLPFAGGGDRMAAVIAASQQFVGLISPLDLVELVQFDLHPERLTGFTGDKTLLHNTIGAIQSTQGTAIYDAGIMAVQDLVSAGYQGGSVVLLTDGEDNDSTHTEAQLIDAANAAGVHVWCIGVGSSSDYNPLVLQQIADGTGGHFYEATDPTGLTSAFHQILLNLHTGTYDLTWSSQFAPGTPVQAKIVYKEGTAAEQVIFDGNATIVAP